MLKFSCADVGVHCDFVATGETLDEVKQNAFAHANTVHQDLIKTMSQEQLADLVKAVEANTKPV
jgi:predicted small metal-binding protein